MSAFIKPFIWTAIFIIFSFGHAQKKPKVGLVLSGGGAKGLAHIGALKVIEEAGVKIDYVGGTSMGAIIGGLYAAGYSADQLDSLFRSKNLNDLIQDNVPRGAKTFYGKENDERYVLSLPFDDFAISFPAGISTGQDIYGEFVQLLYHVKDVRQFKNLPRPFICIATNIETGEPIVLDRGYLAEAIMASGTLPSLFEPTIIDENVLIDGGVVNNYPIDQVKALGADVIIGIDVQDSLAKREALSSATDILVQINNYRTAKDMEIKKKYTDIYIKPAIGGFSVIDFDKTSEIIETGNIAAKKVIEPLRRLAKRQGTLKLMQARIPVKDSLVINRMTLQGNSGYSRGYIKGLLRFNIGEKIAFKDLQEGMNNITATENFSAIRYRLESNGLGTDLIMDLNERPNKMFLKFSAHYDNLFKSGALLNLTRKKLLFDDDVASFDFILGDHLRYDFKYHVDKGTYWGFGINSSFSSFDKEVGIGLIEENFGFENDGNLNEINLSYSNVTNQVYLQTVLKEEFAFRMGVEHKYLQMSTRTILDTETAPNGRRFFENSSFYGTFGNLRLDTYDDAYFPSSGLFFNGNLNLYLFSSDFNNDFSEFSIAQGRFGATFGITPKISLNLETEGGFKTGTSSVSSFDFLMGGFGNNRLNGIVPFYGFDFLSLQGDSYVSALAKLDYKLSRKGHLLFATNIANIEDGMFRSGEWLTLPDYIGFGTGLGFETILGPLQCIYSWSPQNSGNELFVSLGFWF